MWIHKAAFIKKKKQPCFRPGKTVMNSFPPDLSWGVFDLDTGAALQCLRVEPFDLSRAVWL